MTTLSFQILHFSHQVFQGELKRYRKWIQSSSNVTSFYNVPHESRHWLTRRVLELTQLYELLLRIVPQRIEFIFMHKVNTQAVSPGDDETDDSLGVYFIVTCSPFTHLVLSTDQF